MKQNNLLELPLYNPLEICGIDEAGRGCIGGSLFVCGVILTPTFPKILLEQLQDSKKLSQKTRDNLAPQIQNKAKFNLFKKSKKKFKPKRLIYGTKEHKKKS